MKQKFFKYYPYFLLILALCLLTILNLFFQDHWLDSDMAAEMIFSRLLAQEGRIFASPDWCYSTEFRFLYTHLIMGPLFRIMDNWHGIRTVTNLVFYGLLLGSYFYFIKPLKITWKAGILTSLLLLLPFSETMMLHMQIGNTYLSHVIILFFYFGMFLRLWKREKKGMAPRWLLLLLYLALSLICGVSGIRYLLAMLCPLVLTAFLFCIRSDEFQEFRHFPSRVRLQSLLRSKSMACIFYSLLGFAGAIAGYGVNVLYISRHYSFQTYESTNFIAIYDGVLLDRLQNAVGALLMLFGYIPDRGVISLRGLVSLTSFVFLCILIFCTVKCFRKVEGERFFTVLFLAVSFFVNCFAFLFTTSTLVPRYYITVFIFALPVLAFYFAEEKLLFDRIFLGILLGGCLLIGTGKTILSEITVDKNASKRQVAQFLAENNYHFGFATYDNGNIITELTNGRVEIANVWDPQNLNDFKWSSPAKYYEAGYHDGPVFLLLTREETTAYADAASIQNGELIYEDHSYQVFLYDSVQTLKSYGSAQP